MICSETATKGGWSSVDVNTHHVGEFLATCFEAKEIVEKGLAIYVPNASYATCWHLQWIGTWPLLCPLTFWWIDVECLLYGSPDDNGSAPCPSWSVPRTANGSMSE